MITTAYLLGFGSLLIELVFFHTPSVANTKNFFKENSNYGTIDSVKIRTIYQWSFFNKCLLLAVPSVIINGYFLLPFCFFFPTLSDKMVLVFKSSVLINSIGVLCVVAGRIVTFGSMLYLRGENQQKQDSFKLYTSGIFAYTRNPGLDGMFLFFCGFCLLFPSLFMWLGLLFYFFYMRFRVQIEEEFLKQLFGENYNVYLKKTRRFLLI